MPYSDETIEEIYTSHCLEHIKDLNFVMEECFRVLVKGGIMHIKVPSWKTSHSFRDPSHIRYFTPDTFSYFTKEFSEVAHFRTKCDFKIKEMKLENPFEIEVFLEK